MALATYESYKDSGVEWLGEIPKHWEVERIKNLAKTISGGTPRTSTKEYWNGDIPWVSSKDMKLDVISTTQDFVTQKAIDDNQTTLLPIESLLMVVRSGILKHSLPTAINIVPLTFNQDIKGILPLKKRIKVTYFNWLLNGIQSIILHQCRKAGTTVESISGDLLFNQTLPIPPIDIQNEIALYLNTQTTLIDQKTTLLQQKIAKYEALKKTLINETVCRGLDKSVAMNDSGVEWIGEIPKH